jgi:hypothetical protein
MAALARGLCRRGHKRFRQSGEVILPFKQEHPGALVGKHVLAEGRAEQRQTLADRREPRLRFGIEMGADTAEGDVIALQNPALLRVEPERVPPFAQTLDSAEQARVEIDLVAMSGQERRYLALDRLQVRVGIGAAQVEEHRADPAEMEAAALERSDGVVEIRPSRIDRDRLRLGPLLGKGLFERRAKMLRREAVKGRRLERGRPGSEQRVGFARIGHGNVEAVHGSSV